MHNIVTFYLVIRSYKSFSETDDGILICKYSITFITVIRDMQNEKNANKSFDK